MKKLTLLITGLCLLLTPILQANANKQSANIKDLQKLAYVLASKYLIRTEGIPKEYRSDLKDFQEKLYTLHNKQETDELNHLFCYTKKTASVKKRFKKRFKRTCATKKINKERKTHLSCHASHSGGTRTADNPNAQNPFDASLDDISNCSDKKLPKSVQTELNKHLAGVAKKAYTLLLSDPDGIALLKEYQHTLMPLTEAE